MPTPPPPTPQEGQIANHFLTYMATIIGGLVTLATSLIAWIAHGFKRTQEDQQEQLDEGVREFTELKLESVRLRSEISSLKAESVAIRTDIKSIREWVKVIEKDIDEHEGELGEHHDFIIQIKERHKSFHGDSL